MEIDKDTILKAWKSEEYRSSLDPAVRDQIPARPTAADGSELSDEQLEQAAGGTTPVVGAAFVGAGVSATIAANID
jgi:mersacidin/lichenicidin family type 2 lantibiotic